MLTQLRIRNYRSLADVAMTLGPLTVVVGPNGSGKSNLYQSLRLVRSAAAGTLSRDLLAEGGMPSALWAGSRGRGPVRMSITLSYADYVYELEAGLIQEPPGSPFVLDPEIKRERLYIGPKQNRHTTLIDRATGSASLRDVNGELVNLVAALDPAESILSQVGDPGRYPEIAQLRRMVLDWRFYHHFDRSPSSAARRVQSGVRTFVLAPDGADLGAALATVINQGDGAALEEALTDAFPGYGLHLDIPEPGRFGVGLMAPGLHRPLSAAELSDGQLQFLCLAAALLTGRPPRLLVLNEPETSLHPTAVQALAGLILRASQYSQVWVTTHDQELARTLGHDALTHRLEIDDGATRIG